MDGILYQEHLDFFEEAKNAFTNNELWETYMNLDETLIALRFGKDRDCLKIYELGNRKAFLNNVIDKAPELILMEFDDED